MQRRLGLLALMAIVGLLSGCDCAYGGPGCGLPGLEGLCEARLQVGQAVVATAVYGDDTGYHPALVRSVETMDATVLDVAQPSNNQGELALTANALGDTGLKVKVDGWDQVFTWSFTVQDQPVQPANECPDALIPDPAE